jgi:hypothetical protein
MRFSELLTVELNSKSQRVESKVKVKRLKEATSPAHAAEEHKKGRILQLL